MRVAPTVLEMAQRLLDGEPGASVMRRIEQHYTTLASRNTACGEVRKVLYEVHRYRPPGFDDGPLRAAAHLHPDIAAFLDAPVKEQVRQRRLALRSRAWPEEALRALASLQLSPPGFGLDEADTQRIKQQQKQRQIARNEQMIEVAAEPLLDRALHLLQTSTRADSVSRLALPLLLVSGRRMGELLNGRSKFEHVGERCVRFTGQLKCGGRTPPYEIPLLCSAELFLRNVVRLRWKQGDVSHLDQSDVTARYEPALREALGELLGVPTKLHGLRAIYLAFVYATYATKFTLQRVAMQVLGHQSLGESNSYNFIRLTQLGKYEQAFGALC